MAKHIRAPQPHAASITFNASTKQLVIANLTIDNPDVYHFLAEKKDAERWVEKALIVGCIGLRQMTIAENVDFVEKEFQKFLIDAKKAFADQTKTIDEKLKLAFDMKNSTSMISQFKAFLEEQHDEFDIDNADSLFSKFKEFMEDRQASMDETFDETFSLQNNKSSLFQFKAHLDKTFDMKHEDSPLNQFKELIEEYFDEKDGRVQEIMESYFDEKEGRMKLLLETTFSLTKKDSAFSTLLEEIKENTGLEQEAIEALLNPNKTDSPIKLFKEQLFEKFKTLKEEDIKNLSEKLKELRDNEIKDIRDEVLKKVAISEEKQRGTSKGQEFEELIYERLQEISTLYEDKVHSVGGITAGRGKTGDICIDLNSNPKQRIVVECKNSSSYKSTKKVDEEIGEATKNRGAKFCIFLFADPDQMPSSWRPIKITDSAIITCADGANLYLAYRVARILLTNNHSDNQTTVDISKIAAEVQKIEARIATIDALTRQATTIVNAGNYLQTNLGRLHDDIERSLDAIQHQLGTNQHTPPEPDNAHHRASAEADNRHDRDSDEDQTTTSDDEKQSIAITTETERERTVVCPVCQKEFTTLSAVKKYCSYDCQDTLKRLKNNPRDLTLEEKMLRERLRRKALLD